MSTSIRKVPQIRSQEDFHATMWFVICRIYSTPSMVDKLPKYIMERVDMAYAWGKKGGMK
jgi:hypothetical protein